MWLTALLTSCFLSCGKYLAKGGVYEHSSVSFSLFKKLVVAYNFAELGRQFDIILIQYRIREKIL